MVFILDNIIVGNLQNKKKFDSILTIKYIYYFNHVISFNY